MKSARVICYAILSFLVMFALAAGAFFFRLWASFAVSVPPRSSLGLESLIPALRWALVFALYLGILLTMNYAFRKRLNGFLAFVLVSGLFFAFTAGASALIDNLRFVDAEPVDTRARVLGGKGLILHSGDSAIVLLEGAGTWAGARVVAAPGEAVVYQALPLGSDGELIGLPPIAFSQTKTSFFEDARIDFAHSAWHIASRFESGFAPFALWTGALIAVLTSLSLILRIATWPMASLFFGAAFARGVLALEVFVHSSETQRVLNSFLRGLIPANLVSPLIFGVLAALMLLYVILLYLARGAQRHG